jgi:hypothetical protein
VAAGVRSVKTLYVPNVRRKRNGAPRSPGCLASLPQVILVSAMAACRYGTFRSSKNCRSN